ncbi:MULTISPECIES: uroporphyrinogen-III synthase [Micrococcaceae]|uniref:Uroporphyrinogen-III synthase n=1 Tax=Arthrobacter rhombi TaxID=71253 RepID=A0A1R4GLN1_9MICC|nr:MULTISPECIES: uroporphyrinogen-III synthase [Micrococcaceae]PCC24957.1 uroporphyrinogen-III synthase [Glutamicibacter sp. BW78]SJM69004.1 Uroporphyrinogen-III synthase [Arthrobacter rhombi]
MPDRRWLAGRSALLLRSADRSAPTVAELAARGATTLLCPLIDFELPEDTTGIDDGIRRLADGGFDWLLLTSRTTVLALQQRSAALGVVGAGSAGREPSGIPATGSGIPVPEPTRIAVVGEATARAATAAGLPVEFAPETDHSARGMLAEWPAISRPGPGSTVFMPQADIASSTLADGMRHWGADAFVVTAYRTVDAPAEPSRRLRAPEAEPAPAPLVEPAVLTRNGGVPESVDAVFFTSPSIVRRYLALVGTPPDTVAAIAIGDSTAEELRRNGWEPAAIASTPTPAGLADAWEFAVHDPSPPGEPATTDHPD